MCLCSSFPGSLGSDPGRCKHSCLASACLCRNAQHGCFPSNLTEKLQWMATCFCKQFAKNFAILPDGFCIALFSNHFLFHCLSRYLFQIPALDMLWDQSCSVLHLLSFTMFKICRVQGAQHLQDQGWILDGNHLSAHRQDGLVELGAQWSLLTCPGTHSCTYSKCSCSSFRLVSIHGQVSCKAYRGGRRVICVPK